MKLLHTSDLHIGRRLGELSLIDDQRYILAQILDAVDAEKPDGMIIAGDVYDKTLPSAEAVELFDDFLTELSGRALPVYIVSGNHDSPERLNFGSRIFRRGGIVISGVFDGMMHCETFKDAFGDVHIYLLPYIKPAVVRQYLSETIDSCDDAVRAVIAASGINPGERSILVAHQFVTGFGRLPELCDSESVSVGGLDNIDVSAFDAFDYVALGHIHGPQRIGRDTVRYAGSPLKYSFSEARHHKSLTLIELKEKGELSVRLLPLRSKREVREIKGPIEELLRAGDNDNGSGEDYIRAVVTDEGEVYDAVGRLRSVYKNLLRLDFENARAEAATSGSTPREETAVKAPGALFEEFYHNQKGAELTEPQKHLMKQVFEEAEALEG